MRFTSVVHFDLSLPTGQGKPGFHVARGSEGGIESQWPIFALPSSFPQKTPDIRMESKHEGKYDDDDYLSAKGAKSSSSREEKEEMEAEQEWASALNSDQTGEMCVPDNAVSQRIIEGFRINYMNMRDADTGKMKWESGTW
jgi:hypothetical protein